MNAYLIADGDPSSSYAKGAKYQIDTILGDNDTGYSFLLGFGDKWPTHIHHRAANPGENGQTSAENPSAKYTNYGMLVGGIDGSGYEDHADRYQYTEGALDYNGCFAIACSFAAAMYGGDASAFDPKPPIPPETTSAATEPQPTEAIPTTPGGDQKIQEFTDVISEIGNDYVVFESKGKFTVARTEDLENFRAIGSGKTVTVNFLDYNGNRIMVLNSIKEESADILYGDANCDGKVSIADSTAILQHLGNQDKYGLSEAGLRNADVDETLGVNPNDALVLQMIDAKLLTVDQLPLR